MFELDCPEMEAQTRPSLQPAGDSPRGTTVKLAPDWLNRASHGTGRGRRVALCVLVLGAVAPILSRVSWSAVGNEPPTPPGLAWQSIVRRNPRFGGSALAVALDSKGSVLAAGIVSNRVQVPFNIVPAVVTRDTAQDHGFARQTVVKLKGSNGAVLWRRAIRGFGQALAVDHRDNAVVAGVGGDGRDRTTFNVVKRAGGNGRLVWRRDIHGKGGGGAAAVAVDANDDVVAAGNVARDYRDRFVVAKFGGKDGREVWRQVLAPAVDLAGAQSVAVDASGDVVAGGTIDDGIVVVKLAGASGQIKWRQNLQRSANSAGDAHALVLDGSGDVIVADSTEDAAPQFFSHLTVSKLAGEDGAERWRRILPGEGVARTVTVDPKGDVIAGGQLSLSGEEPRSNDFVVVKLSGASGEPLWQMAMGGTSRFNRGAADAVVVGPSGTVVAAGELSNFGERQDLIVVTLAGATGAQLSRVLLPGADLANEAFALATDTAGDVFGAGDAANHFTVMKLLPLP
jgi:hypothetical protein